MHCSHYWCAVSYTHLIFRKKITKEIEYGFGIIALTLGIIFVISIPTNKVGWDEETHFKRAYQMSIYPGGEKISTEISGQFTTDTLYNYPYFQPQSYEEKPVSYTHLICKCYIGREIRSRAMVSQKVKITNPTGLHLRPAGIFSNIANKFECRITFEYENSIANAKSVLSILGAGIKSGDEILLICEGEEEEKALKAIDVYKRQQHTTSRWRYHYPW